MNAPDAHRQLVTLYTVTAGDRGEAARAALARGLDGGTVGAPDEGGMIEVELSAPSHEEALARVRDAIAAAGVDDQFIFPATTGTEFRPPWRRVPEDEPAAGPEPPHLERGGAREEQPTPQDPPGELHRQL
jgi:hypothetical protein